MTTPQPIAFEPGLSASLTKTVSDEDVQAFAALSLDDNPVHLDEEYAKTTRFGGRIAHGMLAASLISAVIGTRLPGYGTVYLSQTLTFKGPVRLGDTITATATIKAVRPDKPIVTLETVVHNARGELVLTGEAVVLAPR
jgi:3-hydroxybutyryl-CoA dehydratase